MCEHYKYFLQIKPEFDDKFKKTGIHSQFVYLCEVDDVKKGIVSLNYDKKRFNLIVKECGKCRICRFKRASIKACQTQCELKTTGKGTFVTLTFGNEQTRNYIFNSKRYKNWSYYKKNKYCNFLQWSLEKRELTLFMKRFRKEYLNKEKELFCLQHNLFQYLGKKQIKLPLCYDFKPTKIRFVACGEYGELKSRPHYHLILLGVDLPFDETFSRWSYKQNKNVILHHNHFISNIWQFGEVTVDRVNYQACNYVARYVTKKTVNDNKSKVKYGISESIYNGRLPEYCRQSNRRGIGYDYFIKNAKKIISDEYLYFTNLKGEYKSSPLPNYFKQLMKKYYPQQYRAYRKKSLEQQLEFSSKSVDELFSREQSDKCQVKRRFSQFVGNYEKEHKSIQHLNYENFNMKKLIFGQLENGKYTDYKTVFSSSYSDTEFIELEKWRLTCFKNFEKYRRNLFKIAKSNYIIKKVKSPDKPNLMLNYFKEKFVISLLENPFKVENLDILVPNRERWLNYE